MRWRLAFRVTAVLLVGFVALRIWTAVGPTPEGMLAAYIAELRARGEPVSLHEMDTPMPPEADNGADDLDAAIVWIDAHPPDEGWELRVAGLWNSGLSDPFEESATPEQMAALRALLTEFEPFFEVVNRGASKSEIAWPLPRPETAADVQWTTIKMPGIQRIERLLTARAVAGVTAADRADALVAQVAIGARLRARTLLDRLAALSVHKSGCQRLRAALECGRIDPNGYRARLEPLLDVAWDAQFAIWLRASRARQLDAIPFWIDGSMQALMLAEHESRYGSVPSQSVTELFMEFAENVADGRFEIGDAFPSPEESIVWLREAGVFLDDSWTARQVVREQVPIASKGNEVARPIPRARAALVWGDALARLARISLAAYAHRDLNGGWPSAPAELAPLFPDGVPVDPFTGTAFVFERDGDNLVVRAQPWPELLVDQEDVSELGHIWRLPPR